MRELKFRGKLVKDSDSFKPYKKGTVITGGFCRRGDKCFIVAHLNAFEVEPESVSQYTGLKDKNGNEIYEGDLLKGNDTCVYKVYWNSSLCAFGSIGNEGDYMGPYTHTLATNTGYLKQKFKKEIEVIGNIYENPEKLATEGRS